MGTITGETLAIAVGLVLIFEGVGYALVPDRMKEMLRLALAQPEQSLRLIGLTAVLIGLVVIWLVGK